MNTFQEGYRRTSNFH